ncbi:MAG TPA: hypothetical protein VFK74_08445 [Azospira sp.]|nr:hypothetical protein [Azospira sp.]
MQYPTLGAKPDKAAIATLRIAQRVERRVAEVSIIMTNTTKTADSLNQIARKLNTMVGRFCT